MVLSAARWGDGYQHHNPGWISCRFKWGLGERINHWQIKEKKAERWHTPDVPHIEVSDF